MMVILNIMAIKDPGSAMKDPPKTSTLLNPPPTPSGHVRSVKSPPRRPAEDLNL